MAWNGQCREDETKDKSMKLSILAAAVSILALASGASAEEHVVQMLNKGEKGAMVFQPDFVKAAPGDTVRRTTLSRSRACFRMALNPSRESPARKSPSH
jgi:plastocyanin